MIGTTTSGIMATMYGSIFAMGSAAILSLAQISPEQGVGIVEQYGVVGLLFIFAGALWVRMEKQEKEAKEYRDRREEADRKQTAEITAALGRMSESVNRMRRAIERANGEVEHGDE